MPVITYPKTKGRRPSVTIARAAPAPAPPAPPSGALINAILSYADICEEIGDGLVLLRVSPERMNDKVIAKALGRETARLADVSLIWNEDESEIHSVLDAATPMAMAPAQHEDPQFELTPLALAYLEAWSEDEMAVRAG
jgi:hypothetical protein